MASVNLTVARDPGDPLLSLGRSFGNREEALEDDFVSLSMMNVEKELPV